MSFLPTPKTLVGMIESRGHLLQDQTAFFFKDQPYSYTWIWQQTERFAAGLVKRGVRSGDRVAVMLPNQPAFFYVFYGIQRLGAIAVPIFSGSAPERCRNIMMLSGARHLVLPDNLGERHLPAFMEMAAQHDLIVLFPDDVLCESADVTFPVIQPDDVAYIQYTSGSTADPRGVQLTHRNLLTNVRQMMAGMQITAQDIFVNWLPVYHDMGLILMTMTPFYLGASLVLLPTTLRAMQLWLKAIDTYGGTFTAAPDMAYRLCCRSINDPEEYDLGSLRVALNAAEPVRVRTMEQFEEKFGIENVLVAGYGLAEATVGVSMWPPGTKKKVDADGHVSVGPRFPMVETKIVDGDQTVSDGHIGEIAVRSPANTPGYYNNPEANRRLRWRDNYILTGDLGYIDEDGDLFIVSRKKNLIIQGGRNVYPADIEEVIDVLPEFRRAAAIGIERDELSGEQLYVFAEVDSHRPYEEWECIRLIAEIVRRIHEQFGLRPGRVYLVRPTTIPFTPNGKMQHQKLKELYVQGALKEKGRILFPEY